MDIDLKNIENELQKRKVPRVSITANRRNFPKHHRRLVFGITRGRYNGKIGESYHSKKYPRLYHLIMEFGKKYIPIDFTSVIVNNNVVCPKHLDNKNIGTSAIIACGQYTGCKLMIEGVEHDPYYNIITFNGSTQEHWNTDDLVGNRYSLVFYKSH
jgi:hypothetical protein